MFETYNTKRQEVMAINSMQAMKLAKAPNDDRRESQNGATQGSSGHCVTLVQAEKMLKTLVEEGWLEKSRKGYYSLSPRALMELRGWLIETYNAPEDEDDDEEEQLPKIKYCYACKDLITVVSQHPHSLSCQLLTMYRDRDATSGVARFDCMISARRTSSVSTSHVNARCVRQSAVARVMWASVQSPHWIRINRAGDKMATRPDGHRLSTPMQKEDQTIRARTMRRVMARTIDVAFLETPYPEMPLFC